MNRYDLIRCPRKRRQASDHTRVWGHLYSSWMTPIWSSCADWDWSHRTSRHLSSYDLWDWAAFFSSQCHQWDRCRTGKGGTRLYSRYSWYPSRRIYTPPGEVGDSRELIRQKASSPKSPQDAPRTQWDPQARWCGWCSCDRISDELEGEIKAKRYKMKISWIFAFRELFYTIFRSILNS